MSSTSNEHILEMFVFETTQLLEQLEQIIISSEESNSFSCGDINEIFRIMHTIKGSSAMMMYEDISNVAHSMEDIFHFIRESSPSKIEFPRLTDLVLKAADFVKTEIVRIQKGGEKCGGNSDALIEEFEAFLAELKTAGPSCEGGKENKKEYEMQKGSVSEEVAKRIFRTVIRFDSDCKMESIRAFAIVENIKEIASFIYYYPSDKISEEKRSEIIKENGFEMIFRTDSSFEEVHEMLVQTVFLNHLSLEELDYDSEIPGITGKSHVHNVAAGKSDAVKLAKAINQSMVSVSVAKLDRLLNLVGELVISEAMLTQNPDLRDLSLDNFSKAARQHRKIARELQDVVMSIRMVPLTTVFHRMNRIVRDMCSKQNKDVRLEIIGEETEVDKNIIEHLSDPLMHIIRNSIDHGIEPPEERKASGKSETGLITLEAKNSGWDVLLIVKDDGRGLDRGKILAKAKKNGLLKRPEKDLDDREVFSFIFLPGFSTNDTVSEYSGRGVGMDVALKNIEKINGTISVESTPKEGTTFIIKIPLTLAIMNGMTMRVGKSLYTLPITSINESFRIKNEKVIVDPDGNEMVMVRGECYPVFRLYKLFGVDADTENISDGIVVMAESGKKKICIFVDELICEQQVVVKVLPKYIENSMRMTGIEGCTLLGDGSISLILKIEGLISSERGLW